ATPPRRVTEARQITPEIQKASESQADAAPQEEAEVEEERPVSREPSREIVWLTSPDEMKEIVRRETQSREKPVARPSYTRVRISQAIPAKPTPPPAAPRASEAAPPKHRTVPRLTQHAARRRLWRRRLGIG